MNDCQLDRALAAMGRERMAVADPRALHERAMTVPLTTASRRLWPPSLAGRLRFASGAMKLVVAGAVVALFGGFLLAAVTQRSEESVPAAGASANASVGAVASPNPTVDSDTVGGVDLVRADLLPGVDLATEEVEPGVFRVLSDDVRDLSWRTRRDLPLGGAQQRSISVGDDGSVWLFWPEESFRLGDAAATRWGLQPLPGRYEAFVIGPDATAYRPGRPEASVLVSGGEWGRIHRAISGFAVGPDGVVWAIGPAAGDGGSGCPPHDDPMSCDTLVFRIDPSSADPERLGRLEGAPNREPDGLRDIWVRPDGEIWLYDRKGLSRFDGARFERLGGPMTPSFADMGPGGTLWVEMDGLHRYDGVEWTRYEPIDYEVADDESNPARRAGYLFHTNPFDLAAGSDGSVWLGRGCDGVTHFDGTTATVYGKGLCVFAMDSSPDGSAWLQAAPLIDWADAEENAFDPAAYEGLTIDTYVVLPETEGLAE